VRIRGLLIAALTAIICSGCVTWITSEPFTGSEKGVRYSLPAVFLRVTPQPDGTMKVEKLILPDKAQEYVVRADSIIAKYTFNVSLDSGLLTSAVFNPDTTGVAAQAVQSAGNVLKGRIDATTAAQAKNDEEAQKAKKAAADAQTELVAAEAKLQQLKDLGKTGDALVDAQVAVAVARARFERARQAASTYGFTEFNAPGEAGRTKGDFPKAWGPVLYKVVMATDRVALQPVAPQQLFDTSIAAKPAEPRPKELALIPKPSRVLRPDKGEIAVVLEASEPLAKVDADKARLIDQKTKQSVGKSLASRTSLTSSKGEGVKVVLDDDTPKGLYTLELVVHTQAKPAVPIPLEISLEVER
jgi:hypothetical protein